jgi:hypothetical protein
MSAPVQGTLQSSTQLPIQWSALTSVVGTGNSPIISYKLEVNPGTNTW